MKENRVKIVQRHSSCHDVFNKLFLQGVGDPMKLMKSKATENILRSDHLIHMLFLCCLYEKACEGKRLNNILTSEVIRKRQKELI
jgi:hypothetical protein